MEHSLLVTRPNHDGTMRYISSWAKEIVKFAQAKGMKVFDLREKRANRREFESMVRKNYPALLFFNGHGDYDYVSGQDNEELVRAKDSEGVLKSKVVYALSCRSGKVLGPSSIQAGAEAYIGYDEDFIFLYDENQRFHPERDKTAELFKEPSNQVMVSLLKGHAPKEAHANSKQSYIRRIRKLLTSQSNPLESSAVKYLLWDMQHQVCCVKTD